MNYHAYYFQWSMNTLNKKLNAIMNCVLYVSFSWRRAYIYTLDELLKWIHRGRGHRFWKNCRTERRKKIFCEFLTTLSEHYGVYSSTTQWDLSIDAVQKLAEIFDHVGDISSSIVIGLARFSASLLRDIVNIMIYIYHQLDEIYLLMPFRNYQKFCMMLMIAVVQLR